MIVRRGDTDARVVAFTFDAGSDVGATAAILDLLDAEGIAASFALTGDWAAAHPDLVRRIATTHRIVNHTADHRSFTGYSTGAAPLTRAERIAELTVADATIRSLTGRSTRPWFRPPYGDLDAGAAADAAVAGWPLIALWTVDSLGWQGLDAAAVARRCLDRREPGAIYLFHVGARSTDVDALPAIVAGLRADGYAIGGLDAVR